MESQYNPSERRLGKFSVSPRLAKITQEFLDCGGIFKPVSLAKIFDEPQSGDVDLQNNDINGKGYIFINSGITNQGIKGYTDRPARVFPGNTITIDFFGNAYYRPFPYKLATHNHVFSFSGSTIKDELVGLYLVAAMSYLPQIYSYGNMATKKSLKKDHIIIPYRSDKIDFTFMRRYIATLKAERVATLKAYLQAAGLSDTILSESELAALDALRQNRIDWRKVPVCGKNGAFNVINTHNILKSQVVPGSGNIPYVGAGESNNSIQSYITFDSNFVEKGNSIMIGGKTLVITYQEQDYVSNDSHNLALYYKDTDSPGRDLQLFLVSALYKSLKPKYHWGDSISKTKIKNDILMLPVKGNGDIDYAFIKSIISAESKLCINEILQTKDLEISATEEVITDSSYFNYDESDMMVEIAQAAEPFEVYKWQEIKKTEQNEFSQKDTVLIGCYRDKKHLEWILENHIYNIRLGNRKGSADSNQECFNSARLLYLYNLNNLSDVSIYRISEHRELSGTKLKSMGYPKKSPGKKYMTFKIAKIDDTISGGFESTNLRGVLEKLPNHVKGTPVFIEPDH